MLPSSKGFNAVSGTVDKIQVRDNAVAAILIDLSTVAVKSMSQPVDLSLCSTASRGMRTDSQRSDPLLMRAVRLTSQRTLPGMTRHLVLSSEYHCYPSMRAHERTQCFWALIRPCVPDCRRRCGA